MLKFLVVIAFLCSSLALAETPKAAPSPSPAKATVKAKAKVAAKAIAAKAVAAPAPTATPKSLPSISPLASPAPVEAPVVKTPFYKKWWSWAILGVVAAGAAICWTTSPCNGNTSNGGGQ